MPDSALSPRDIQARVRAGASVAEVAEAAGVPEEHVEPFAGPVLAERAYMVETALDCPVRRRGEPSSARSLREIVGDRLKGHHLNLDDVDFDAWRDDDRRWHVSARYVVGGEDRLAELLFDPRARFSIPGNDEGRWLVGEPAPISSLGPRDPDSEPTVDLNDEWAIVRAVQVGDSEPDLDDSAPVPLQGRDRTGRAGTGRDRSGREGGARDSEPTDEAASDAQPIPIRRADTSGDPPDYAPAHLEQVDGVYDIVPQHSDMDVLYEMLAGFNEDSVKIYAGLTQPVTDRDTPAPGDSVEVVMVETYQEVEIIEETAEPTRRIRRPVDKSDVEKPTKAKTRGAGKRKATKPTKSADESVDAGEPSPSPRRSRKKGRAQVPSWDEIMFGGPGSVPEE